MADIEAIPCLILSMPSFDIQKQSFQSSEGNLQPLVYHSYNYNNCNTNINIFL